MSKNLTLKHPFMLKYCPDRYKTFDMCKKSVDVCLLTSKYFPDWFVILKIQKAIDNACLDEISICCNKYEKCKAYKKRFKGCSMASIKMMRLVNS